ncbi:MAG: hypothetical protein ACRBCS_05890 [Cellvibrionaceae bacterium]
MMNPFVDTLFQITRRSINERHISDFSPVDPGYESYVQLWTRIFQSGEIPHQTDFDLSEVIGLTGWEPITDLTQASRFRDYRRFTSSVGVALIALGNDSESVRVANYLARDLIIDSHLNDREHFAAVRNVFPQVRETLIQTNYEEEYPFFTLRSLILAHMAGDFDAMPLLASRLIDDEASVRNNESLNGSVADQRFLFGLTNYDQLNRDWVKLTKTLTNPTDDPDVKLVIDTIAEYAT